MNNLPVWEGGADIKRISAVIIGFVGVFIVVWFLYRLPYEIKQEYTASTLDGETIEIRMELKCYRDFFRPTIFYGTMFINEQIYDVFEPGRSDSLITRFKHKLNGNSYFPIIAGKEKTDLNNHYVIYWAGDHFNQMYFLYVKNNTRYLAPAKNAEEALQLLEGIEPFMQ